ncbi:uncharacterized protein LOC108212907 isoform X2 [Daucus carota subsp. sativus]|uniref:uncharacterized protein LOC108212907 isoform X2 n=1 Tax=Daucus carota subsp. sativus TaxID=79200 RepID=UPI0030829766
MKQCLSIIARCAIVEPVLHHEIHEQHVLTLVARLMYSSCDACGHVGKDMCYTCLPCQFWIHRTCALSPPTIKLQFDQDDTLHLIYSIPHMYRAFSRHCRVCRDEVMADNWAYFCEDSGYFVHINCATTLSASGEKFEMNCEDKNHGESYLELLHFPLPSTDSLTAILVEEYQSSNRIKELEDSDDDSDFDGDDDEEEKEVEEEEEEEEEEVEEEEEGEVEEEEEEEVQEDSLVINHWSHLDHPLILLEELKDIHNDESDRIHDMLVCNGCTMPISNQNKYYGCIGCNFFLHPFCANHLPLKLAPGKCARHPQHYLRILYLTGTSRCMKCQLVSNGFVYWCSICLEFFDLFCCLAPEKIKHSYHNHPLVQNFISRKDFSHSTGDTCNACLKNVLFGFVYRCQTCSEIQICQRCALSTPKTICHRWDSHKISLIYPPIYYKGLRYCETCELEVNQEAWMYRCGECDQSFHPTCILPLYNMKLGRIIALPNLHHHKLTLVMIDKIRYPQRIHKSFSCSQGHSDLNMKLHLHCALCNYYICINCAYEHIKVETFMPYICYLESYFTLPHPKQRDSSPPRASTSMLEELSDFITGSSSGS